MHIPPHSLVGQLLHRMTVRRWRRVEQAAKDTALPRLARQRTLALRLQRPLRRFVDTADRRLAEPITGGETYPLPPGTDWTWRPKPWRVANADVWQAPAETKRAFTQDIVIFHDCGIAQTTLRQITNSRVDTTAPYGLMLDVLAFTGSYLSLVIEVPKDVCADLRKRHILRLVTDITCEHPTTISARLYLRHGPNTEQIQRHVPDTAGPAVVEFDLAYTQLNEKRAEAMWIDLMIAKPAMNAICLRDLTLARYPRAEMG